jgi:DNA-binding helix-hairpin-helix protein with protein kinase domain
VSKSLLAPRRDHHADIWAKLLGGQGGEGAIYELATDRNSAAKIFTHAVSKEKAEKDRLMVAMRNSRLVLPRVA